MDFKSFVDTQDCRVDDKRRFSLPTQHRPYFTSQTLPSGTVHSVVLVPWFGGCLAAWSETEWMERLKRIRLLDDMTQDYLTARRQVFPRIKFVHTDPVGRLTLAPEHLEWLRLPEKGKQRSVMVTGADNYLEIWNAEEWPDAQLNGKVTAARDAAHLQYEKQLDVLARDSRAAQEALQAAGGAPAAGAAGKDAETKETG